MIKIELFDGAILEFPEGTDQSVIDRVARDETLSRQPAASADTNMLEQSMSGVNEGLASLIGAPVDLMTGAVNLIPRGINAVAGTNIPLIENGFGGSGTVKDVMGSAISDVAPQTRAQRFGRRLVRRGLAEDCMPGVFEDSIETGIVLRAKTVFRRHARGAFLAARLCGGFGV